MGVLTRANTGLGFWVEQPLVSSEDSEPVISLGGGEGFVASVTATAPVTSSGGTNPNIAVDEATSSAVGVVKPDNSTITVAAGGVLSATGSGVASVTGTAPI